MDSISGKDNKKYQIRKDFILREILGEAVIVTTGDHNPMGNATMAPNGSAAYLWKQFQQPRTVDEVVTSCLAQFTGDEKQIRADIEQFVTESIAHGIMEEIE